MFKDLEKAEEPEIQLPTSAESKKNKRIPEKTSTSASLTMLKTLTFVLNTTKLWKVLKEVGIPEHFTHYGLVQNWERSMSTLYIVILLFQFICRVHTS